MGYRSNVGFCIKKSADLPDFTKVDPEFSFDDVRETDEAVVYLAEWVKWSEEFGLLPAAVREYFDKLDCEGRSGEYLYIIVGEDLTDIEMDGGYYNNPFGLGIVREIFTDDVGESLLDNKLHNEIIED